jgi:hypothetical protein
VVGAFKAVDAGDVRVLQGGERPSFAINAPDAPGPQTFRWAEP